MSLSAFSVWTQEHLRGAQRLAQQDAEDMERLDRLIRWKSAELTDTEAMECSTCGEELPPTNQSGKCARCYRREWMQANREGAKEARRKLLEANPRRCPCGAAIQMNAGGRRKFCDACQPHKNKPRHTRCLPRPEAA